MKPIYMYAGGKSKLIARYADVWPTEEYSTYVEPFFGGGAVYGWLEPSNAILNDVSFEIMGLLYSIRETPSGFLAGVHGLVDEYLKLSTTKRKEWYYRLRQDYWDMPSEHRLYVLMRLGFNGVWQTCKASGGLFGTPSGLLNQKDASQIVDDAQIIQWSETLKNTNLYSTSYENIEVPENSLVYLDPPYRDSFTTYGTGFDDEDQKNLVKWAKNQAKNSKVLLANRYVEGDSFFEDLLPDAVFHYFDVTYTAGRRKREDNGTFSAKPAREFLAIL